MFFSSSNGQDIIASFPLYFGLFFTFIAAKGVVRIFKILQCVENDKNSKHNITYYEISGLKTDIQDLQLSIVNLHASNKKIMDIIQPPEHELVIYPEEPDVDADVDATADDASAVAKSIDALVEHVADLNINLDYEHIVAANDQTNSAKCAKPVKSASSLWSNLF